MPRKPKHPCLQCGKKRCSEPNIFCNPCDLQARIDATDVAEWREKLIAYHQEHEKYRKDELLKPRYKLFMVSKNVGKSGRERWLLRGDVALGYPSWGRELKKINGSYERVPVMEVHCYAWRTFDIGGEGPGMYKYYPFGERGRFDVGHCIIRADAVVWLEGDYTEQIRKALQQKMVV